MRITEAQLRKLIREELLNDGLPGFMDRTAGQDFSSPKWDPTFELEPAKPESSPKKRARSVKQAWNIEADHKFIDSLTKVHWFKDSEWRESFPMLMTISGKNEISTMGYLPGSRLKCDWGTMGVIVRGRTTLAANSMNAILSGFSGDIPDEVRKKYRSSGIPKRPTFFSSRPQGDFDFGSRDYILDRESFDESMQGDNELIIGNWRPIGAVLQGKDLLETIDHAAKVLGGKDWRKVPEGMPQFHWATIVGQVRSAMEWDLPVYDSDMRRLPEDSLQRALAGELEE